MSFHKDVPLVQTSGDTYYPRTTEESVWGADGERLDNKLNAYKNSIQNMEKLQTAGGTSTAITLTGVKLESGFTVTFIVKTNNNGNSTTINGKYLYKHGTTTSPKLVAGKAVTIWYNGTHFFIKASAEGNAIADNVLAGKTFSNDDDTGITGTMATNISVDASKASLNGATLTAGDMFTTYVSNSMVGAFDFTLPTGYYKGPKRLHIPELLATNIKAGTKVGNQNAVLWGNGFVTGTFTSDANATAGNILSGKTAYVNGAKVTGNIPIKSAETITPGTVNKTIASGLYLNGTQTIAGDADLVSANIKAGANIFGVAGNSNVVDTSAGDAVAGNILSGKKAYVDGSLVTGNIPSQGAQTITPGTVNKTIASGRYLSGTQTITGDADLIPANILSGKNIFGVAGIAKRYASGTTTSKTSLYVAVFYTINSSHNSSGYAVNATYSCGGVSEAQLGFTPTVIIMKWNTDVTPFIGNSAIAIFYPKGGYVAQVQISKPNDPPNPFSSVITASGGIICLPYTTVGVSVNWEAYE